MLSTPPATASSICPVITARAAVPTACAPLAQSRLMVLAGTLYRQPGQTGRHARHVAVIFAHLVGATVNHLVDRRRIDGRPDRHLHETRWSY